MDIVKRWMDERDKHPFFGEKLSAERISEIWNKSSATYTDGAMGDIPDMVTNHLFDIGILSRNSAVLDVGCGPGTYALRFAGKVGSVTCLDESPGMLNRLINSCKDRDVRNVSSICEDWNEYESDDRFDVVFSSLCPPLNCPGSLEKMESYSEGKCVYLSSMTDDRGSIHMDIWKELGKDYTYNGYDTRYPYEYLISIGRDPTLKVFETFAPMVQTIKEVEDFEIGKFSAYMVVDDEIRKKIKDVVSTHSENGVVHSSGRKQIGMLVWSPI